MQGRQASSLLAGRSGHNVTVSARTLNYVWMKSKMLAYGWLHGRGDGDFDLDIVHVDEAKRLLGQFVALCDISIPDVKDWGKL